MRKSTLKTPQSVKEGVLHISDIDILPCDVTTCPRPALGRPSEQWTVKWRVSNRGTKAAPNLSLRLTGSRLKAPHILIKIQSYRAGGVFWQRNCPPPVPLFWYYMLSLSPLILPLSLPTWHQRFGYERVFMSRLVNNFPKDVSPKKELFLLIMN